MKFFFTACFLLLTTFQLFAQSDSSQSKPPRAVTFHISNGVSILQSEQLKTLYDTKALYFWGLGIRLAPSRNNNTLHLSVDYNFSSYSIERIKKISIADSLMRLGQLVTSISIKLLEAKDVALRAHTGYAFSFVTDKVQQQDGNVGGLKIGLALERRLSLNQSFHIFLDYDFTKLKKQDFRDYDTVKLGIGFYL